LIKKEQRRKCGLKEYTSEVNEQKTMTPTYVRCPSITTKGVLDDKRRKEGILNNEKFSY
jgi:hypothetical protein